jgi:hypothetical protein
MNLFAYSPPISLFNIDIEQTSWVYVLKSILTLSSAIGLPPVVEVSNNRTQDVDQSEERIFG